MAVNQLIRDAVTCGKPDPRYAYMAPLYKQAKDIAWDYLKRFAGPIPGVSFNESELRCELPGNARIKLLGAENADALRGIYLDGIVLDEYAYMSPTVWQAVIRPALVDRQGYAIFMGTPLGRNHFSEVYDRAKGRDDVLTMMYRASETGVVPADELAQARAEMGPDLYAQEFECSFEAAIPGAYYARQLERARADGRIRVIPWEPKVPVNTYWDLGFSDATAIIFAQTVGKEIRILDYLEANGRELAWYARQLQEREFLYGEHVLPHDAGHEELRTGKSIATMLRELRLPGAIRVLPQGDVDPGIEAARQLFPRCWFHETKCAKLIDALASYRAAWDEKNRTYKGKPQHDWASHGADAFRYLAVGHREPEAYGKPPTLAPRQSTLAHYGYGGRRR